MSVVKVSIIVPVYNAGKYLEKCIRSILMQTLQEIEIIIINDGSTDGSKGIISANLLLDTRIVFIDSENCGPGAARNKGLKMAKGEYIGFVDADDWILPEMFEYMYENITENSCDLGICNVIQFDEARDTFSERIALDKAIIDLDKNKSSELIHFLHFKYDNANWNKLYSAKIIRTHSIRFNEKMMLWEDLLFNLVFLQYASKAVVIDKAFYHYLVNPSSAMSLQSGRVAENYNLLYEAFMSAASKEGNFALMDVFRKELSDGIIGNVVNFVQLFSGTKPGFWKFISQFSNIIKRINSDIYLYGNGKNGFVHKLNRQFLHRKAFFLLSFLVSARKFSGLRVWSY